MTPPAVVDGILLALQSAGITIVAIVLAAFAWFSLLLLHELVVHPVRERSSERGLARGLFDWAEDRWSRWRSGTTPGLGSVASRIVGTAAFAYMWGLALYLLYRLVHARVAPALTGDDAPMAVVVALMIVWTAGPWQFVRGDRALPYPASSMAPPTSYLAASPGYDLPSQERHWMVALLNLLRECRILIFAFAFLCLPKIAELFAATDADDSPSDVTGWVFAVSVAVTALLMVKGAKAVMFRAWLFEQIDMLLAAHHPEALPRSPKGARKKPEIGPPLQRIERGLDRLAFRAATNKGWYGRVLQGFGDRINVYRQLPERTDTRVLDEAGIALLERAGAVIANSSDYRAVIALAAPVGVIDADEQAVRIDRIPDPPSWIARTAARAERGWKVVTVFMMIAAALLGLIGAATGSVSWQAFLDRWSP